MIKVKVCGMRDRLNVQQVAGAGTDFLGYIFYPGSRRYVGAIPDNGMFKDLPAGIQKAGVFVDEQPEVILELAERYSLQLIQLHGAESPELCMKIRSAGLRVIKAFGIAAGFDFNNVVPYEQGCDFFLFDSKSKEYGGTGLPFVWDLLEGYRLQVPFYLSGGIGPEDAKAVREFTHPALYAVDINSRFEIAPGIKDADKVRKFIQELRK